MAGDREAGRGGVVGEGGAVGMRVLVCGGRDYQDRDRVFSELNKLCGDISDEHPLGTIPLHIIHGGCPTGTDLFADEYAVVHWCGLSTYEPDWNNISHPDAVVRRRLDGSLYDAKAGPRRNQRMIDDGKPDLVVAFPGGRGTADMVRRARAANIAVLEIRD